MNTRPTVLARLSWKFSDHTDSLVPIRLPTGSEYVAVVTDVVRQLERLARHFEAIYAADASSEAGG